MVVKATSSITIADVSDGLDGTGISSTKIEYQAGSSGTSAPTGTWSTSVPSTSASSPYLWTRVTYNYSDGRNPEYVYSVGSTPEGIEIGGRNLLLGSTNPVDKFAWDGANGSSTKTEEDMLGVKGVLLDVTTASTSWQFCQYTFGTSRMQLIKPDTYYTLSFDIYPSIDDSVNFCISDSNATNVVSTLAGWKSIIANQWNHISLTVKTISNITISSQIIYIHGINSVGTYKICNFKLEEGNKATDWTPAPEDFDADIQSVKNQVTTNLLKPTLATTTQNGITCTNNGNGTYTLNGTASANTPFYFISSKNALGLSNFVGKKLKLLGNPVIGDTNCRLVAVNSSWGTDATDVGNGSVFTLAETTKLLYIDIKSGFVCDNLVFKPMITTNLNVTYDDFVPYTGSTGSLNGDLANNSKMTEYAETVATQTANKFNWIVKSGTSATDFTLTDRVASLLSTEFNIDALTTFKNSAENGTSTVINGGSIKSNSIKADKIDTTDLFAQSITATGTITGGSFVGSSFEGATGSFTGSITATSGKIGFMDVTSTDIALNKGDKYGEFTLSDTKYIKMSTYDANGAGNASYLSTSSLSLSKYTRVSSSSMNSYRQYGIDVTPSQFLMRTFNTSGSATYTTTIKSNSISSYSLTANSDVTVSGYSTKNTILNHVRVYELTIGSVTINSNSPWSMSLASTINSLCETTSGFYGACLKKCWPASTWAFSCTLLVNGTDVYIATTTTQAYNVSILIFYNPYL